MGQLTVAERILLHLSQFSRIKESFECPEEVTQSGISSSIGISRPHAALELKKLRVEGKVEERVAHIPRGKTRRRAYFLSIKGEEIVSRIKESTKQRAVRWIDLSGSVVDGKGLELINALRGVKVREVSIYEAILTKETIDLRSFQMRGTSPKLEQAPKIFYGRNGELGRLRNWLEKGEAKIFCIIGIAGIGKTSLASFFSSGYPDNAIWARTSPFDSAATILATLASALARRGRRRLQTYMERSSLDFQEALLVLREEVLDFFLVIDDCNASKDAEALLKLFLEDALWQSKVLVTSRERPSFYNRLHVNIHKTVEEMKLGGLDEHASRDLLRGRRLDVSEADFESIYQLTHGHPLMLQILSVEGLKMGTGDLQDYLYREALQSLPRHREELVYRCSVFRKHVRPEAFGEATMGDLRALLDRSILVERDGEFGLHDSIKELVLRELDPHRAVLFHGYAADYWSTRDDCEALYHLFMAARKSEVCALIAEKGEKLIGRGRAQEMLDIIQGLKPPKEHEAALLLVKGSALDFLGRWDEALDIFSELRNFGERSEGVEALVRMGRIYSKQGVFDKAMTILEEAASVAREKGYGLQEAYALKSSAIVLRKKGKSKRAGDLLERCLELLSSLGKRVEVGRTTMELGVLHLQSGHLQEALGNLNDAVELVKDSPEDLALVYNNLGIVESKLGNVQSSVEYFERSIELSKSIGQVRTIGYAMTNAADNYVKVGNLHRALEYCTQSLQIFTTLKDPLMTSAAYANFGNLYKRKGEWDKAEENFRKSIDALSSVDAPSSLASRYLEFGAMYEERGDALQAKIWKERAEGVLKGIGGDFS